MLLDEPFSGLDARLREQIRDDTLRVLKRSGTATLLVTHDPEEAMFMADRIYLMQAGKVIQSGPPAEVYARPNSEFAAKFFPISMSWMALFRTALWRRRWVRWRPRAGPPAAGSRWCSGRKAWIVRR